MSENICPICEKPVTGDDNFEGVIHVTCKERQDEQDFAGELKAYEEDLLKQNWKGQPCWLDGRLCQEGWCNECFVYQNHLAKEVNRR